MTKRAGERLFEAVGQLPEEIILEAQQDSLQETAGQEKPEEFPKDAGGRKGGRNYRAWAQKVCGLLKYIPAAACLCIVFGGTFWVVSNYRKTDNTARFSMASPEDSSGGQESSESGSGGYAENIMEDKKEETAEDSSGSSARPAMEKPVRYDAYEGPVFALTATGDTQKLSAARNIKSRVSACSQDGSLLPLTEIEDKYRIKNTSENDKTLQLVYPFAAALNLAYDMDSSFLQVDGQDVPLSYNIGDGVSAYLHQDPFGTSSLQDYKNLLDENTEYFEHALEKSADWSREVSVYTFTGFRMQDGPQQNMPGVVGVTVHGQDAQVLTYGFDYSAKRDDETSDYCFFASRQSEPIFFIAAGELESEPELGFYTNLDCEEEIQGIECTMKKQRMPYTDVLKMCARTVMKEMEQDYENGVYAGSLPEYLDADAAYRVLTLIGSENEFYDTLAQRYKTTELKEIYRILFGETRVVFAMATVTVPAGQAVKVTARIQKKNGIGYELQHAGEEADSREFGCDFMPDAQSRLNIVQTVCSINLSDEWQLTGNNMGLKQKKSVWKAVLDDKFYYFQISECFESETTLKSN